MIPAPSIPLWRQLLPNAARTEIIARRDAAGDPELVDLAAGSVVSIGQNELVTDSDLIERRVAVAPAGGVVGRQDARGGA